MRIGVAAAAMLAISTAAFAAPGDPMITLLAMRPIPERALIVELRDPDGVAVWPVTGEIRFDAGPPKKVTLGRDGVRFPLAGARPVALWLDASRWGARPASWPIDGDGGVRITLRYVPGD